MTRRKSFFTGAVAAAVLAVVAGALAACGSGGPSAGEQTSPPPTPATFDEGEWTIVTPAGWTHADATPTVDAKKAVRYRGPNGEYFIVAIDPAGSDFILDTLWNYEVKGDRFEVVSKRDCTGSVEQGCSSKDARYDGYIMWKSGTDPQKVGGHVWYFIFGNTTKTTIDPTVFEGILESIKVKG